MIERMAALADRLERNRKEAKAASDELRAVVIAAYSEGCSVTFISSTLGITRQTVYTILKEI